MFFIIRIIFLWVFLGLSYGFAATCPEVDCIAATSTDWTISVSDASISPGNQPIPKSKFAPYVNLVPPLIDDYYYKLHPTDEGSYNFWALLFNGITLVTPEGIVLKTWAIDNTTYALDQCHIDASTQVEVCDTASAGDITAHRYWSCPAQHKMKFVNVANLPLLSADAVAKYYNASVNVNEPIQRYCVPQLETEKDNGESCSVGNPCSITTGDKFQKEVDWQATTGPLKLTRFYNSFFSAGGQDSIVGGVYGPSAWTHNYNLRLSFAGNSQITSVTLLRADGKQVKAIPFGAGMNNSIAGNSGWFIDRDMGLRLSQTSTGWSVVDVRTLTTESYDSDGLLTKITYRNQQSVSLIYVSDNMGTTVLSKATDNFGRSLSFSYIAGRLSKITLPNGKSISYSYDSISRLSAVTKAGFGTKTYKYSENSQVAPSGNPNLLTGIVDEKGVRYANYAFDGNDRGILTEHAGGTQRFTFVHNASLSQVTDPYGVIRSYAKHRISGSQRIDSVMRGTLQEAQNTYDDAGNLLSRTQYGLTTNYSYDLSRNLEISRTEAVGTPQARTITTQWSSTLPVPSLVTESGRTTVFTYDTAGNPLTRKVTDTFTQTARTWTYSYNTVGQLLKETDPAGQATSYTYATNGNLLTSVDALNNTTRYNNYTALGQPGQIIYPNGNKIDYIYDDAGRVTQTNETIYSAPYQATDTTQSTHWPQWIIDLINAFCTLMGSVSPFDASGSTVATVYQPLTATASRIETTKYSYDLIGQLATVVMPSGETLTYGYDNAHRLVSATDSLGNSITYTLNGAGDITNTTTHDPTGNIKVQTQHIFDNLGHLQKDVGNNDQSTTYGYDNFDNLTSLNDALTRSSSSTYDALNRKSTDVDAMGQTIKYGYNALDQLLTITDARNNITTYTPNAFGETTKEVSPDTGTTTSSYTNGRLSSVVDSNNMTHGFSYDNLGRVTKRTDSGPVTSTLTTQYGYDQGTYGKGYLTSISNETSTMRYSRDSAGNVIENVIAIGATPLRVQYKYLVSNKVSDIVMPSGRHVKYTYTAGKITSISQNGISLLSNVKYSPNGIASWTWGATAGTDSNTFGYDLDGRLTNVTSTGVLGRGYSYDTGNRILTIQDTLAGIGNQSYVYDNVDRLTKQTLANLVLGYSYDVNGNRTQKTQTQTTLPAVITNYVLQTSSNRINTSTTNTSGSLTSTYLPTGQLVSDGIRTYSYDAAGRSTQISKGGDSVSNRYNGLGQRVIKSVASIFTYFIYDESGHLLGEYDQNRNIIREYIWFGDRLVGMSSKDRPNILLRVLTPVEFIGHIFKRPFMQFAA